MQRGDKKKKQSNQWKSKSVFDNSTKSQGVRKLFIRFNADVNSEFTNLQDWLKDWWKVKIGTYGQEYQNMMIKGVWDNESLEQKLDKYRTQELKPIGKEYWIPTADQDAELDSITEEGKVKVERQKMFVEWVEQRTQENSTIRNNNNKTENYRKWIQDNYPKMNDQHVKIFSDMYGTIEYEGQRNIDGFTCRVSELNLAADINVILGERESKYDDEDRDSLDGYAEVHPDTTGDGEEKVEEKEETSSKSTSKDSIIDFGIAKREGNWIWLLKAAIETHMKVVKNEDSIENRKRVRDAENRVKNMKYEGGSFLAYLTKYEDKLKIVENLGGDIPDLDKIHFLIMGLPKDLFSTFLGDYSNVRMREKFPQSFYPMVQYLKEEYNRLCLSKGSLVTDYKQRGSKKSEPSFKSNEGTGTDGKKSQKAGKLVCAICDKNHETDSCSWRNKSFSPQANRGYYERMKKRENPDPPSAGADRRESKSGGEPTKAVEEETKQSAEEGSSKSWAGQGTVAKKPTKEVSFAVLNQILNEEYDADLRMVCDNVITEMSCATKIYNLPDEIDFVYDTATVSGIIKPSDAGVLQDVRRDPARVIGVGGAVTELSKSGQSAFGKMRIMNNDNEKNLISHIESEEHFQLLHPKKGVMILKTNYW